MIDLTADYPVPVHRTWDIQDSTKIQEYLDCPRKYFFRYVLGWDMDVPNQHLIFGEAWHKAMEVILELGYTKEALEKATEAFFESYRKHLPPDTDDQYKNKNPNRIREILAAYMIFYQNRDDFNVRMIEIAGQAHINDDGDTIHYRLDAECEDKGGIFALEHKTSQRQSQQWTMQWPLSIQIGTYTHVLYSLHNPSDVWGVKINGTFFKTRDVDFMRLPIRKTPDQMQVWLWTVQDTFRDIKHDYERLSEARVSDPILQAFPQRPTSCTKYFGCPYHDFCMAWPNPLQEAQSGPEIGFKHNFWDPSERTAEAKEIKNV